jgi:exodeoxyribonuclease V beta subunit
VLEDLDPAALDERCREAVARRSGTGIDPADLAAGLRPVLHTPLGPPGTALHATTLGQVAAGDRLAELDFELPLAGGDGPAGPAPSLAELAPLLRRHLPAGDPLLPYADVLEGPGHAAQTLRGYLAGSVDVVLRVDGRYLVVDYKTNYLGPRTDPPTELTSAHYAHDRLDAAMSHSSYPLQALLYAVVLHRFLRWRLAGYDPAVHLGGVLYLYLRGMCGPGTPRVDGAPCGVFAWRPPVALVEAVSDLLDGAA